MDQENESEIEEYGDPGIRSADGPIPFHLKVDYVLWPIVGLVWFFLFWNGSWGWLDRGYWHELQKAAGTTVPTFNIYEVELERAKAQASTKVSETPENK